MGYNNLPWIFLRIQRGSSGVPVSWDNNFSPINNELIQTKREKDINQKENIKEGMFQKYDYNKKV